LADASWWTRFRDLLRRIFGWEPRASTESQNGNGHPVARGAVDAPAGSKLKLVADQKWQDSAKMPLDPALRVALVLIEQGDPALVFERTGIVLPGGSGPQPTEVFLPLHIEVTERPTAALLERLQKELNLTVPTVWLAEADRNASLRSLTAQLKLLVRTPMIDVDALRVSLLKVINHSAINRVSLATPMAPCDADKFGETLGDFGMPVQRKITIGGNDYTADGKGVVIGIIDDGCCYANWNFLRNGPASRILYIWDQGRLTGSPIWTRPIPSDLLYGYELVNTAAVAVPPLDAALKNHTGADGVVREDDVYDEIDFRPYSTVEYRPFVASTHGTHVMDIAAGNGRALFSREGVAPAADIIFVQLPREKVFEGGPALSQCIADGVAYVFDRAKQLEAARHRPVPAVVNVSYGNYVGPHDGSSLMETTFDYLLAVPDRAIVVSAGNGFAAHCHAKGKVTASTPASLHWLVESFNESMSLVDIWYTGPSDVDFYLTPPGATQRLGPVTAGGPRQNIVDGNNNNVGYIDHIGPEPGNGDNQIVVMLNATWDGTIPLAPVVPPTTPKAANAPSGTWVIAMEKPAPVPAATAPKAARFHAWIERNESLPGDPMRRRQSRFADNEAHPKFTVTGYATGVSTIAVGAYKTATAEMAEYSACGPSRPSTKNPKRRTKPEICAPAAADARGRGVRSAATRFALDTRMGGTSASAPHVAGLAALVLQLNRDVNHAKAPPLVKPLSIADLRQLLVDGALAGRHLLRPNTHQWVDEHQPYKQRFQSIWKYLKGNGAVNAGETLKRVK
jgi:subtilisin family serine protease